MEASKLTSKFQATVPKNVRDFLGLEKGDLIGFELKKGQVTVRKISPLDWAFARSLESTFNEWQSANDEEAYRDL
ncbi:MAG TPA: AbrB/MazE/SpoVT family DNA-binding domain-containing protein [bacterium]|nr:AbrB/MazE/SpoVT family DNA-binding domain-containing protein [bacterium]